MATVKFLNAAGKYDDPAARDDVIRYITQKVKTPSKDRTKMIQFML